MHTRGYSHIEWVKRASSSPPVDASALRRITAGELATHSTPSDAWVAIDSVVYDVTEYANYHPGGAAQLMRGAGKDATELFKSIHRWVSVEPILRPCVRGLLHHDDAPTYAASNSLGNIADETTTLISAVESIPCLLSGAHKSEKNATDSYANQRDGAADDTANSRSGLSETNNNVDGSNWARAMLLWHKEAWASSASDRSKLWQLRFELPRGNRLGLSAPLGQGVRARVKVRRRRNETSPVSGKNNDKRGPPSSHNASSTSEALVHVSGLRPSQAADEAGVTDICRTTINGMMIACTPAAASASTDADHIVVSTADLPVASAIESFDGLSVTEPDTESAAVESNNCNQATDGYREVVIFPASDPLATDYFDIYVIERLTSSSSEALRHSLSSNVESLLLQLQPGDVIELSGLVGLIGATSPSLSAADEARLKVLLTPAAWRLISIDDDNEGAGGVMALHVPYPQPLLSNSSNSNHQASVSPVSVAAWRGMATKVTHIGILAQGVVGVAVVMPLLHSLAATASRLPSLLAQQVLRKAPTSHSSSFAASAAGTGAVASVALRCCLLIDYSGIAPAIVTASDEKASSVAVLPFDDELQWLTDACGGALTVSVLRDGSSGALYNVAAAKPPIVLSAVLGQLQRSASVGWPPPSESTVVVAAGDGAFCAAVDRAARDCYYLSSHIVAIDTHG